MELTRSQQEAVEICVDRLKAGLPYTLLTGAAGTGKAQPDDTLIPTPNGFKELRFIKVGDYVFDRTGQPTRVLGVFPQGMQDCYQVTLTDGRSTVTAADHLWTVLDAHDQPKDMTTLEMLEKGVKGISSSEIRSNSFSIPRNGALQFEEKNFALEPYILGSKIAVPASRKPERERLNWDKVRIPVEYFNGSVEQRMALMRGMLDTNGTTRGSGRTLKFISRNQLLSQDFARLAWSLGYGCILAVEDWPGRHIYYTATLECSVTEKLNLLTNEKIKSQIMKYYDAHKPDQTKVAYKRFKITIDSIEKLPMKRPMICLFVGNPEHLYLTENYIVTHNTTITSTVVSTLGAQGYTAYAAPTGKAAQVLKNKGNEGAVTIHKLIYDAHFDPKAKRYVFTKKKELEGNPKYIVVDEFSMVNQHVWEDLLSFHVPVLALGDQAQLPPVSDSPRMAEIMRNPHAVLTEIMRQESDNEIIDLATDIRLGKPLCLYKPKGENVRFLQKWELSPAHLVWADQVLCATNKTRIELTRQIRKAKGFTSEEPQIGDLLICSGNHWNFSSMGGEPLTNGLIGKIIYKRLEKRHTFSNGKFIPILFVNLELEDGDVFYNVPVDYNCLLTGKPSLTQEEKVLLKKEKRRKVPIEMDYGWAITVHRAQGSEWDKVLIVEESFPFDRENHKRHLYTAITRSAKRCLIVQK